MRWQAVFLSVIAALALPVVGLVTGRVVGDFFLEVFAPRSSRGNLIGALGAGFGVLVYALALASSYSHLRHYYRGYEAQGVRASWALALAVEVATFYMSFAYVVIHSAWAFWGSLIGAFVVFWGNLSSMYEARTERARAIQTMAPEVETSTSNTAQLVHTVTKAVEERSQYEAIRSAFTQSSEALLSAEAVETKISQVRQSVRAVKAAVPPEQARVHFTEPLQAIEQESTPALSEGDKEVLRLAASGPVGPSSVSRALGIAKSSAGDRLRRLERMGLLVKQGSSYLIAAKGQGEQRAGL